MSVFLLFLFLFLHLQLVVAVEMLNPEVVVPSGYTKLRSSKASSLYQVELPSPPTSGFGYATPPLLVDLRGTHKQIGFDYASLLHNETSDTFTTFQATFGLKPQQLDELNGFIDWLWTRLLEPHTPQPFLDELEGMRQYHLQHGSTDLVDSNVVARRFYVLANMPADAKNIIAMLENDLEEGWPEWLKKTINWIIEQLEKLNMGCDAFGVWGSRTANSLLFTSRNLDYNSNTGINKHKLVTFISLQDPKYYSQTGGVPKGGKHVTMGFAFGLGALAGQNALGVTTSEMNLDNSVVTFQGVPFPARLRYVLQQSTDLSEAMTTWDATNNTNSFNFMIGSATDSAAYALETIRGFTAHFGANDPIEQNAVYNCTSDPTCSKWTNGTGLVRIGKPLPEAVFRSNHGFHPRVMKTQEPLFRDTVSRYDRMHDLFAGLQSENIAIDDKEALGVVASLGTKGGPNPFVCDASQFSDGENVMSIVYAPGLRKEVVDGSQGYFFVAWESGSGSAWRPAACSRYVRFALSQHGSN
eukprot:CAMPEP_0175152558 /NCGR_PEP_ID=MMETSP0087-20121206/19184_1 /TAXON_ID=136419 /ORGANISM="Unknown Unknown, Strain D1" /LENGTH=525 /DNA_ID=CAMNT_0016439011 /DNA_START=17 /DNA_END=1594 /DNA_ORIENTATION=+